jgi:mannose-1-phosphate guanylyltransferase
MIKDKNHYAIIMAGGVGSRFWPSSRAHLPKQFLDILGVGKSLLQLTYERFSKQFDTNNILVVTNQNYVHLVKSQIPEIADTCVLGEPSMKNTAACIAYAVSLIHKINTHALCVVAPSDHLILDEEKFLSDVTDAMQHARQNNGLITLGIRPSRPDTGYGYIQYFHPENDIKNDIKNDIFKVKTFTEKPTLEIAQTFIESGDFLWNAGIFVWSVSAIKQAFKKYMPEHYALFKEGSKSYFTSNEKQAIQTIYEQCRSISIDYGIMEKADNVYVIPVDFGWSDLGTWTSLYENCNKDNERNVVKGKQIMLFDTNNCLITSEQKDKLMVINGVNNLIVVDTPDVLLICDKTREQEVKQIVTEIKLKFEDKFI